MRARDETEVGVANLPARGTDQSRRTCRRRLGRVVAHRHDPAHRVSSASVGGSDPVISVGSRRRRELNAEGPVLDRQGRLGGSHWTSVQQKAKTRKCGCRRGKGGITECEWVEACRARGRQDQGTAARKHNCGGQPVGDVVKSDGGEQKLQVVCRSCANQSEMTCRPVVAFENERIRKRRKRDQDAVKNHPAD